MPQTTINVTSVDTDVNITSHAEDDYTYDLTDGILPPLGELIPVSLMYGLTLILGMTGNLLVIVVVARYRSMKNITNTFLLSLASADLLLVCICIPVKFAAFFTFSWTFGEFLCKGVSYLQNVSALCSVFTLTVMSMERYYAIIHPMRAKYVCTVGRARRAIVALWSVSLVMAMPIVFQKIHKFVGERVPAYWCVNNWEDTIFSSIYEMYMLTIMLILPLTVMSFAYVSICKEFHSNDSGTYESCTESNTPSRCIINGGLRNSDKGKQGRFTLRPTQHSPPPSLDGSPYRAPSERSPVIRVMRKSKPLTEDDRTRRQVIKMLVAVIVIFVVCWAPILVSNVLTAFGVIDHLNYDLKPMRVTFYLLAYANSCANPLIYGFMSRHFRQTFLHAICTCVKGREYTRTLFLQRQNSYQTRSTHTGYSKAGSDLELTVFENNCSNCVGSSL